MMINRDALAALFASFISVFFSGILSADAVAIPVDLSANVIESVLPGGTVFHDSKLLFGAERTTGNLRETIGASAVPEATMSSLMLLGLAGLLLWRWNKMRFSPPATRS
jgi:hypothetical protein